MPFLTGTQIIEASDKRHFDTPVPEWGGDVRILVFSCAERERFERETTDDKGKVIPGFRELLLARTLANGDSVRLFADSDVGVLAEKSGAVVARLFDLAMKVNGFTKDSEEAAKGNSEGRKGDSSSGSPAT